MTSGQLTTLFFLQVTVVLTACHFVGRWARKLGQPAVVAEMITGICLGPSLLGVFFPEVQQRLFPGTADSGGSEHFLLAVCQLGLILYMFVVGIEFRFDVVRDCWKSAVLVAVSGMLIPFALGIGVGMYFHRNTELFISGRGVFETSAFLGAALCITAFPMLARILEFRKMSGTRIGTVVLGAGAIGDAAAWLLMAVILAAVEKEPFLAFSNLFYAGLFTGVAFGIVRPLIQRISSRKLSNTASSETAFTASIILLVAFAWIGDVIGLHAVFGAFVAGALIPRGAVADLCVARIQPLTLTLLLPLFFAYSGLHTRIGLLNSLSNWMYCGLVIVVAIVGKFVACWWAARKTGLSPRESLGVGVLMNARGMMELIMANIGRERGLISDELFAMLVLMAIFTTLMTSPLFDRLRLS